MVRRSPRLLAPLAVLLALIATPFVPAAGAFSIRAAVPAAESGTTATTVFAGSTSSCALLKGGQLKCWGNNSNGMLGLGDTAWRGDDAGEMGDFLPTVDLGTGRKAKSVSIGDYHMCAILDNNGVKCWGQNTYGQLGYGDTTQRGDTANEMGNNLPYVRFGGGRRAKALALGAYFTCALLDNGSVKCWGRNHNGQLGLGDTSNRGDNETVASLPTVSLGRRARAISAGESHACALLDNGTVKCWGNNDEGQLGLGINTVDKGKIGDQPDEVAGLTAIGLGAGRRVKAIGSGRDHNCVLLDNGTVKCWGGNGEGSLGLGDTENRGDNESVALVSVVDLGTARKVKALNVGAQGWHNCATLDNGSAKCWGYNDNSGTLGLNELDNRGDELNEMGVNLPFLNVGVGRTIKSIVGGSDHTCALLDNKTVKCWGWNSQGQLGYGDKVHRGDNEPISDEPSVDLGVRVRALSAAQWHSCVILENRSVQCWGWNGESGGFAEKGALGLGDDLNRGNDPGEMGNQLPAVDLGTGRTAKALGVGPAWAHTCAVLDDNSLKCWGDNRAGQLGLDNQTDRGDSTAPGHGMGDSLPTVNLGTGRTPRAVATGDTHTCALLDNGTVKCWGNNAYGQLGQSSNESPDDQIGDEAGEMAGLAPVNLGRKATAIAAGGNHTCALLDNGTVKCWGRNDKGQLGLGDITSPNDQIGDQFGEMTALLPVSLGRKAKGISTGWAHTCALLDNGTVKCWGRNEYGELGQGDIENRGDDPDEMGSNLEPIDLGTGRRAKGVSAGNAHTCALLDNSTVKCWGDNKYGSLGQGDTANRGDAADEMGDYLPAVAVGGSRRVLAVRVGEFSCVLLDDYSVRCWGYNGEGQLGRGDGDYSGSAPDEMGNKLKPVALTG